MAEKKTAKADSVEAQRRSVYDLAKLGYRETELSRMFPVVSRSEITALMRRAQEGEPYED